MAEKDEKIINVEKVKHVMSILEQTTYGEIGKDSSTILELKEAEQFGLDCQDSHLDTCQYAWRLLDEAIKENGE